jgi:hypothetical protein
MGDAMRILFALLLLGCTDSAEREGGGDVPVDTGEELKPRNAGDSAFMINSSTACDVYLRGRDVNILRHILDVADVPGRNNIADNELYTIEDPCLDTAGDFALQLTEAGVCPLDDMRRVCLDYADEFHSIKIGPEYNGGCRATIEESYGCND